MADARLDALVEAARAARDTRLRAVLGLRGRRGRARRRADLHRGQRRERELPRVGVRRAQCARRDDRRRANAAWTPSPSSPTPSSPTPPCGACRQVLWEFGPSALVVSETLGGRPSGLGARGPRAGALRAGTAVSWPAGFRSGIVAVVGRPNVGKSTLVNALVGQKVAIVSNKPQTTQRDIRAIWNTEGAQIVFTDTPGYHKPKTLLGVRLNDLVGDAVDGVDLVVQVVDAAAGIGTGDAYVYREKVRDRRRAGDLCREQGRRGAEARRAAAAPGRRSARDVRGDRSHVGEARQGHRAAARPDRRAVAGRPTAVPERGRHRPVDGVPAGRARPRTGPARHAPGGAALDRRRDRGDGARARGS